MGLFSNVMGESASDTEDQTKAEIAYLKQRYERILDQISDRQREVFNEQQTRFFEMYMSDSHLARINKLNDELVRYEQRKYGELNKIKEEIANLEWVKE